MWWQWNLTWEFQIADAAFSFPLLNLKRLNLWLFFTYLWSIHTGVFTCFGWLVLFSGLCCDLHLPHSPIRFVAPFRAGQLTTPSSFSWLNPKAIARSLATLKSCETWKIKFTAASPPPVAVWLSANRDLAWFQTSESPLTSQICSEIEIGLTLCSLKALSFG